MEIEKLNDTLEELENKYHDKDGYNVKDVLRVLGIEITEKTQKKCRAKLRSMISRKKYPEFKEAGSEDIFYCPKGKGSGKYRLSKYRGR